MLIKVKFLPSQRLQDRARSSKIALQRDDPQVLEKDTLDQGQSIPEGHSKNFIIVSFLTMIEEKEVRSLLNKQ